MDCLPPMRFAARISGAGFWAGLSVPDRPDDRALPQQYGSGGKAQAGKEVRSYRQFHDAATGGPDLIERLLQGRRIIAPSIAERLLSLGVHPPVPGDLRCPGSRKTEAIRLTFHERECLRGGQSSGNPPWSRSHWSPARRRRVPGAAPDGTSKSMAHAVAATTRAWNPLCHRCRPERCESLAGGVRLCRSMPGGRKLRPNTRIVWPA